MTTFRYKGQTAGGAKVSGVLRAYDEFEAADKLRESVAIITKLEAVPEKKESVLSRPVAFRVKEKELALLCSQFAIILASGLSVERCVSMVAAQTKNKYLRRMLDKVSEEVGAGYSLAQSFENNAPYLPKTFTETLRAGEQSGTLESCFQRLHAYYDRSAKTRAKIVSTLTYPVMVIIVAIVVFVIIIAVAVPAFTDAFTDLGSGSLPGVTRALMAVSAFFTKWWLVLGVLALLVIAYLTFRRTERGRAALAAWSLTRAPLRRIHSMNAAAQFAHSMATLLAAGLPLPRALEVTANVVSNYTFSLAVRQVRQDVERGRPMAESMAGIECFPAMLTEMVGVGERSGALEETLDVIGGYYDNEVSVTTARLLAVLEPAITIALAVLVVILLLAVYLPCTAAYNQGIISARNAAGRYRTTNRKGETTHAEKIQQQKRLHPDGDADRCRHHRCSGGYRHSRIQRRSDQVQGSRRRRQYPRSVRRVAGRYPDREQGHPHFCRRFPGWPR